MLTVFIAEDEKVERDALKLILSRYYHEELCINGEATTGVDLIEMVKSHPPDLILMDIQMPQMDGLNAAEQIKQLAPGVEVVIITAYGTFGYAQKAIALGVIDYLVKPYSIKTLQTTLNRVIQQIKQRKATEVQHNILHEEVLQIKKFIEWEFLLNLVRGSSLSAKRLDYYLKILNVPAAAAFICVVCDDFKVPYEQEILKEIKRRLLNIATVVLGCYLRNECILYLFNYPDLNRLQVIQAAQQIPNNLAGENGVFRIGVSDVGVDYQKLHQSYLQAQNQIWPTDTRQVLQAQVSYEKEAALWEQILQRNRSQAKVILAEMLAEATGQGMTNLKEYVKQLMVYLYHATALFLHLWCKQSVLTDWQSALEEIVLQSELEQYLEDFVDWTITQIDEYRNSNYAKLVAEAKSYIRQQYQTISLEKAARHVGLSKYYFSKCFKQVTGQNFIDYLIEVRMEKAKELLLQKKFTVAETAYAVGFTDPNYFSRAFKKYIGVSPKEF
jgi:two-component system response regulator YesN